MRVCVVLTLALAALLAVASAPDEAVRKAARAFDAGEWANAQALYGLVTDRAPDDAGAQGRLLASSVMRSDTAAMVGAVERALAAGVPLGVLADSLKVDLRMASGYGRYPGALHLIAGRLPYLRRPVTVRLLDYYTERRDGQMMVECARSLLAGLPDSPRYLSSLALGLLYCGDKPGAEAAWRRAIEADPADVGAIISLASLLGDSDEALGLLRRADLLSPSPAIKARIKAISDRR